MAKAMGNELLLLKSKKLTDEIHNKNAEYFKSLVMPSDLEDKLHTLLQNKEKVETDLMYFHELLMILKELDMPVEEMLTERKIEKELEESEDILSESKAFFDQNLSHMEATKQSILEALERLNISVNELSQKITALETKYASIESDWQETEPFSKENLNQASNKIAKERILSLLKNAREEKELMEERLSRLDTLRQLAENAALCVESDVESQLTLKMLQDKLAGLEHLSGIECKIIDDHTVAVYFIDCDSQRLSNNYTPVVITLSFFPDENQRLELSSVNANPKTPEIESAIQSTKNDKDIPKMINSVRKAWQSYVSLTTEISSLRESHAIDWRSEDRVFHLMIGKYICRLSVPSSYPCAGGSITVEEIMGGPNTLTTVTEQNPPEDISLSGWVTHLENILT